jgi:aryl-alcohol dehydrogenase-like predicted oxidoreductase
MQRIPLFPNGPTVNRIAMGCWPIAGVTSLGVTEQASLATVNRAIDEGINFFDTAYSYGFNGESDRILKRVLIERRSEMVIAHKVGQSWDANRQRVIDARPETMIAHAKQCVARLDLDCVDLMYLHAPDPKVPIAESAQALTEITSLGLARSLGVCNVTCEQAAQFAEHCTLAAIQIPFNMLQQTQHRAMRAFAQEREILLVCYWIYMKGLLAGKLRRNHQFSPHDKRLSYEIFQGESWWRAQDLIDQLEQMATAKSCTISQLVVAWTLQQPGVNIVLLGAKTPDQIAESAGADRLQLDQGELDALDRAIVERTK